jgi:hypothetical protein
MSDLDDTSIPDLSSQAEARADDISLDISRFEDEGGPASPEDKDPELI